MIHSMAYCFDIEFDDDFEIHIYLYICSTFWENYTGFISKGLELLRKEMFSKIFVFAHSHFLFCALQVLGRSAYWWFTRSVRQF